MRCADQGFVSGDGSVTQVAAADRKDPVSFSGTTLDGQPYDVRDDRGRVVVVNVWGSWCAPCIAEAPALQAVHELTAGPGRVVRRHQHQGRRGRGARAREAVRRHLPEHRRRRRAGAARPARRHCRRRRSRRRWSWTARAGSPRASSARPTARCSTEWSTTSSPRTPRDERRQHDHRRLAGAGAAARGRRRAGVVPVPVRAAAGARLPGVHHRPLGVRGVRQRAAQARPAGAGRAAVRRRVHPGLRQRGGAAGQLRRVPAGEPGRAAALARRHHHRARPGVHRRRAVDAARHAARPQAGGRAGRCAGARHAVRARLDAVHRADAGRGDGARPERGDGAARRRAGGGLLHRAGPAVRPDRARLQPGDDRVLAG